MEEEKELEENNENNEEENHHNNNDGEEKENENEVEEQNQNEENRDEEEVQADFENSKIHKDVSSEEIINLSLNNRTSNFTIPKAIFCKEPKELNPTEYDNLLEWLGGITFSKKFTQKTIAKDFSDCCLYAEILKTYFPKFVELHNFIPTLKKTQKEINWSTVNSKVLKKIGLFINKTQVERIINLEKGYVERHLYCLKEVVSVFGF
jgi:hypothetical protein